MDENIKTAEALSDFCTRAAGRHVMVVRGSISGASGIQATGLLAIQSKAGKLGLLGELADLNDESMIQHLVDALSQPGVCLDTGSGLFPLDGKISTLRPSPDTLVIEVRPRRVDGSISTATDRMLLVILMEGRA